MLFALKSIRESQKPKKPTQQQVADSLGVSIDTYQNWEQCRTVPRGQSLNRLAAFFNVTPDALFGYDVVSPGTIKIPKSDDEAFDLVPLVGRISAGMPMDFDDIDRYVQVPHKVMERHPEGFLVRVDGNSVNKILHDGVWALVDPKLKYPIMRDKLYAVCVGDQSVTVKHVRELENGVELIPDSTDPTFKPMVFDYSLEDTPTIDVRGRVVWYTLPDDFEL